MDYLVRRRIKKTTKIKHQLAEKIEYYKFERNQKIKK
jgi:hypothetical protein